MDWKLRIDGARTEQRCRVCHSRAWLMREAALFLRRPEPVRRYTTQGRLREGTSSRGRAEPAEAPSAAEGEGTRMPRPFTEFTLSEAEGFRAAVSGRPGLFGPVQAPASGFL
jgi:hypothetical protein